MWFWALRRILVVCGFLMICKWGDSILSRESFRQLAGTENNSSAGSNKWQGK